MPSSRGSSQPRDQTRVSGVFLTAGQLFTATEEATDYVKMPAKPCRQIALTILRAPIKSEVNEIICLIA